MPMAPTDDLDRDVLIVGAGMGGLAAARSLLESGRSPLILEARDRVGGRLLSSSNGGRPNLDLGATWFWPGEQRVADLVSQLGVPTHHQHLAGDAVFHQPAGSPRIEGNPIDVPSLRFSHGAAELANAIEAALPPGTVRLGHTAERLHYEGGRVHASTDSATFSARHAILALPPALAVERITFSPPLPERLAGLAASTPVWMGAVTKVVARYERPFWREAGLAGAGVSHQGPLREIHDMSGPGGEPAALFGFVPGVTVGQPTVTSEDALAQLVAMFGPEAGRPIELIIQDWRAEPFTSPADVERLGAYQTFGHALYQEPAWDGRLHWGSTETSTENPGHIEGALAAAERCVDAILATTTNTTITT